MKGIIQSSSDADEGGSAVLQTVFDAESSTPDLVTEIERTVPYIREVLASLRESVPLVPHSGVGPVGGFYRIPNHYRSVNFMLPSVGGDPAQKNGVVVFKGTEPLLADFPSYLDWMLSVPFRTSCLSLGLHFPLRMKLPPAAMWIEESIAEQRVSSAIQQQYLRSHGCLARLPLPLFVFKMLPHQTEVYEKVVRSRLPGDAMNKIKNKIADGLGVEVYYYPELPVRVADLAVGNVASVFRQAILPEVVRETFGKWADLFSEILCLGYMPYAPWHHGMGGCCDKGNACIDGGFNDLLTLVPFEAIPSNVLFRHSLFLSMSMLADSMVAMAGASEGGALAVDPDVAAMAEAYVLERIRRRVEGLEVRGEMVDARLKWSLKAPSAADLLDVVRRKREEIGTPSQFLSAREDSARVLCATESKAETVL